MNNENAILKKDDFSVSIPDEDIDAVAALSDDLAQWAKLVPGGFQFPNRDKVIPELVGTIKSITPYLVKFENGVPSKLPHEPDDYKIPEGFERRSDVKIEVNDMVIGLSLAPSTIKHQLSPYVKYLRNQGLRPEQVSTRIQSRQASNNFGTWNIAVFSMAGDASAKPAHEVRNVTPTEETPAAVNTKPKEWD